MLKLTLYQKHQFEHSRRYPHQARRDWRKGGINIESDPDSVREIIRESGERWIFTFDSHRHVGDWGKLWLTEVDCWPIAGDRKETVRFRCYLQREREGRKWTRGLGGSETETQCLTQTNTRFNLVFLLIGSNPFCFFFVLLWRLWLFLIDEHLILLTWSWYSILDIMIFILLKLKYKVILA